MNKVMVTGLAVGKDVGVCQTCNFDLSWLLENPSTLIWADKIILTPTMWSAIQSGDIKGHKPEFGKSVKLIFDKANAENLVEIANPATIITPEVCSLLETQISKDMNLLADTFPAQISLNPEKPSKNRKVSPELLQIGDTGYCKPYLLSVYASLIASKAWGAQCLFSDRSLQFCKYRFGLSSRRSDLQHKAFQSVFNALMPNDPILPHIAIANNKLCSTCGRTATCKETYQQNLEKSLDTIFKWRDYDEVHQVKTQLELIISKTAKTKQVTDHLDIISEFRSKERTLHKQIKKVFPNIKRFANVTTLVSIPFAVLGVATGAPLLTIAGASVGGLALASKQLVELLQSRAGWVGFIPSNDHEKHSEKHLTKQGTPIIC